MARLKPCPTKISRLPHRLFNLFALEFLLEEQSASCYFAFRLEKSQKQTG